MASSSHPQAGAHGELENGCQNGCEKTSYQNGYETPGSEVSPEEALRRVKNTQVAGMTFEDTMHCYTKWAPSYEQEVGAIDYIGPDLVGEYFHKYAKQHHVTQTSLILDVGAGTGLVGKVLQTEYGYQCLDGVDASRLMLEAARHKAIYERLYCARLGEGHVLPMLDDSYDAAVMSGIFVQGHVKLDAMLEVIRIVKPGGLIVNAMREANTREVEEYKNIRDLFKKWADDGLWECVEEDIPPVKFYGNYDSLVHVYRVIKNGGLK